MWAGVNLSVLVLVVVALLAAAYHLYGRLLGRVFALDPGARTPAHQHADGVDFTPTPAGYLLCQHFSAIAAAGPIVGPILACQQFGWIPCLLWISLGCVLIGAVHDMAALVASVRVVVLKNSAVVVVRARDGFRHIIPGGRREPGETTEQTARREALENDRGGLG